MPRGHGPKDWRPQAGDDPEKIFDTLRELAPSFLYDVSWDRDRSQEWEGDPQYDPRERGFVCYNVEITLNMIYRGRMATQWARVRCIWDDPNNLDADVEGLLPEKLLENTESMLEHKLTVTRDRVEMSKLLQEQLLQARKYLQDVTKARRDAAARRMRRG